MQNRTKQIDFLYEKIILEHIFIFVIILNKLIFQDSTLFTLLN